MISGFRDLNMRTSAGSGLRSTPCRHLDEEWPFTEQRQRALGAAASIEQEVALVGDEDRRFRPVAAAETSPRGDREGNAR